jgi:8-oxo-dGTP pyrophosphatase MutT (NUDIX family)
MKSRGPFKVKSSKTVYKNPWIEVKEDKVIRPDGTEGIFGTVDYNPGVSIVALNAANDVYLVKEYDYVLDEEGIKLPTGGVDSGETPIEAAKRELLEETGCVSDTWISLGLLQPFTTIIKSPMYLFLVRDVKEQLKQPQDKLLKKLIFPFEEACKMVMQSAIVHGGSCVAILKAKEYLQNE